MNEDNRNFIPKTKQKWLGVITDTIKLISAIHKWEIAKLKSSIENVLNQKSLTPKLLAKLAGQFSYVHMALGPIVQLF